MIIAISGTPGVGKHTVAKILANELNYKILDISNEIKRKEIDISLMNRIISKIVEENSIIVSHLSHFLTDRRISIFVILRCRPDILKRRLEERGYSKKKIHDNILFEALDGTYIEAKELHNNVVEIDNSKSVDSTIRMIKKAINGKLKPQKIDYSYFIPKIEKF